MTGEISPLRSNPGTSPDQLRASHEDRDRVIEVLRVAAGDGRLTPAELDERIEIAFSARTYGELAALTSDLPAAGAVAAPSAPKDIVRIECRSGNTGRGGRWVVPRRMELRVRSGNVTLDFTEAIITQPVLAVDAEIRSGNLLIITKPGIGVDTDEMQVRSGNIKVRAPWGPEVPVTLRIAIAGQVRSGNIMVRPPRRTFWQWLLRKPRPYAITSGRG